MLSEIAKKLTICSVNYHSRPYLELNRAKLEFDGRWIVIDNTERPEHLPDFETYHVVPPNIAIDDCQFVRPASYRHAFCLNKAVELYYQCRTKFVLFLDPDFFLMPGALQQALNYMEFGRKYTFFGAPYWPEPTKNRITNFPTAFCMIVNTDGINQADLDFSPGDSTMAVQDTGYKIYERFKPLDRHYCCTPQKRTKHPADEYYFKPYFKQEYKEYLFGVHCHAKLHLRKDDTAAYNNRVTSQLAMVEWFYDKHSKALSAFC